MMVAQPRPANGRYVWTWIAGVLGTVVVSLIGAWALNVTLRLAAIEEARVRRQEHMARMEERLAHVEREMAPLRALLDELRLALREQEGERRTREGNRARP